jgi:hypothetical protein
LQETLQSAMDGNMTGIPKEDLPLPLNQLQVKYLESQQRFR